MRETAITSSSATIVWELDDIFVSSTPETFTILYGRDGADLDLRRNGSVATESQTYSITLNFLMPDTMYFYRVESTNGFEIRLTDTSFLQTERNSMCKYVYSFV